MHLSSIFAQIIKTFGKYILNIYLTQLPTKKGRALKKLCLLLANRISRIFFQNTEFSKKTRAIHNRTNYCLP